MATVADVTIGDYKYRLYSEGTARAQATSKTKTSYGAIQSSVTYQGTTYNVTSLDGCFYNCSAMTTAPALPSGVTIMTDCFGLCSALRVAPTLPAGVVNLRSCFYGCTSLTSAPAIPQSAHNMYFCFASCSALTNAPAIPSGVTNMEGAFSNCTALVNPPASIPSSVTNVEQTFQNCPSLTGRIRVGSAPSESYSYCFDGTTRPIVLDVTNQSTLATWQRVAATSANGNVTTFYPADNPAPTGTINATRVASAGSTTSDESGRYVYVQVATTISTEKAPSNVAQAPTITVDGATVTPTQTSGTASWHGWVALSDDYAHTIGATPNDLYKSGITVTATLPSTYSPMEFHATGDGASFGKHATRSGVLDVAWDVESEGTITSGGDITSGGEFRVDAAFDSNASSVPTRSYRDLFKSFDNQGIQYATVLSWKELDGRDGLGLVLHRVVNGNDVFSQFGVMMKNDGTRRYLVSDPGALAMAAQPDITLTTDGQWEHGCRPYGDYFRVDIPCVAAPKSVTCTNAGMFVNGTGWVNMTYRNYTHRLNMIHLYFDQNSYMTEGKVFVVRMNLTVRFEHM